MVDCVYVGGFGGGGGGGKLFTLCYEERAGI